MSEALYDRIARIYDPWSVSVTEDVEFYVEEAVAAGGPVVELAVGTGRIAVPIARAGVEVIGVDESPGMLAVAHEYGEREGVSGRLDLRVGDLREPPVEERVPLVTIPFRSLLHMPDESQKLQALRAAGRLLEPGGHLVFDVFTPSAHDIEETDGLWLERERGIFERADWNERARTLVLSVRSNDQTATMELHWLSAPEWNALIEEAGLVVESFYGWFDRRPWDGGEDQIWVCRRPRGRADARRGATDRKSHLAQTSFRWHPSRVEQPIATHEDVTTIISLPATSTMKLDGSVSYWRTRMASRKRKKTSWTAEDEARWQRTTRLVRERIAYHSEMSGLLGEREREQRRLEELRSAAG